MSDSLPTVIRVDATDSFVDVAPESSHTRGWMSWEGYKAWIAGYTGTPVALEATDVAGFAAILGEEA